MGALLVIMYENVDFITHSFSQSDECQCLERHFRSGSTYWKGVLFGAGALIGRRAAKSNYHKIVE